MLWTHPCPGKRFWNFMYRSASSPWWVFLGGGKRLEKRKCQTVVKNNWRENMFYLYWLSVQNKLDAPDLPELFFVFCSHSWYTLLLIHIQSLYYIIIYHHIIILSPDGVWVLSVALGLFRWGLKDLILRKYYQYILYSIHHSVLKLKSFHYCTEVNRTLNIKSCLLNKQLKMKVHVQGHFQKLDNMLLLCL